MQSIEISRFGELEVVVKNTFIDGLAEEELPNRISAMRRRKTTPGLLRNGPMSYADSETSTDEGIMSNALSDFSEGIPSKASSDFSECMMSSTLSDFSEGGRAYTGECDDVSLQEPIGSAGHYSGSCRPCVWFWRPSSCNRESSCEYCHLCDSGAVQRAIATRQKIKNKKMQRDKRSSGCA